MFIAQSQEIAIPMWAQLGGGGALALFILDRVFNFLKPILAKRSDEPEVADLDGPGCVHRMGKDGYTARAHAEKQDKAILATEVNTGELIGLMTRNVKAQEESARDAKHTRRINQVLLQRDIESNGGMEKAGKKAQKLALDDTHILDAIPE
jgi:hypothetical protein